MTGIWKKITPGTCLVLGLLLMTVASCGVKAPPAAPDANPPVIATLTHTVEGSRLNLSWALAAGSPVPTSYTLYRSRKPLIVKPCQGCPLVFKRVMNIPSKGRESGSETLPVETGYRYAFKMTATDNRGVEGPASRTIKFSY